MRFLIALYNKETARQNLQFAALMASRLGTDLTILFVEPGAKYSMSQEMEMAREKMSEWSMEPPGLQVLRVARDHLVSMGIIAEPQEQGLMKQLIAKSGDHYVQFTQGENPVEKVTFRYREGDSLSEIIDEMKEHHHELLVIGAGRDKDFMTRLLKFSPSSILIAKNPRDIKYKILAATDGTPPAHRAELLAIKTASFLKMELTFLSVARDKKEQEFLEKHLARMTGVAEMKKVKYRVVMGGGDVVKSITETAGDDHIIFLGRSRRKPLAKFFFGSKTISTVLAANCPMLLVK